MHEYIYYFGGKEHFKENIPFRALLYGEGLFETFRCINYGLPVFYDRHIQRLQNGCMYLSIPMPVKENITRFIRDSLNESHVKDAYVKLCILSSGQTHYSSVPQSCSVMLIIKNYPHIKGRINVDITDYKRNSTSLIVNCKTLNYLENILLKRKVLGGGYDEAILLNEQNYVTECITHNVFWCSDGVVFTPSTDTGILPGIVRSVLIDTLNFMRIPIIEGYFTKNALLSSSFVFITNSISGIVPVGSISGRNLDTDKGLFCDIREKLLTRLNWV